MFLLMLHYNYNLVDQMVALILLDQLQQHLRVFIYYSFEDIRRMVNDSDCLLGFAHRAAVRMHNFPTQLLLCLQMGAGQRMRGYHLQRYNVYL